MAAKKALIVHPAFPLALAPAPEPAFVDRLPLGVLLAIAEHLDAAQDLVRFERVCRSCRDIAQEQSLWRRLTLTKFMMPSCTDVDDWRQLYRFHHNFLYNVLLSQAAQDLGRMQMGRQPIRLAVWA